MADTLTVTDWFGSPFYRKLYSAQDRTASDFVKLLIKHLAPAGSSRIFDTACQEGHCSKQLASLGFDVTGVDISPLNIKSAKQHEDEHIRFYIHDIRLPFYSNYFDLALNLFHSFGYYRTRREHEAAIRTISRSLKPDGVFVIDYPNQHFTEDNWIPAEKTQIDGTTYDVQKWQDDSHFYKHISVSDHTLSKPIEFTEKVAKFSMGDFNDMLSYHGLQVRDVYGDYQLGAYDIKKTPRLIIIADKKSERPADKEKRLYSDGRRTDSLT